MTQTSTLQRTARHGCTKISLSPAAAKVIIIILAALASTGHAAAQAAADHEKSEERAEAERPFEVFAGYSAVREDGRILQGWTGTFIGNINRWFGLAADFDGHYGSHRDGAELVKTREHGFTFGPHVAIPTHSRVTPFAFALLGGAHRSETTGGVTESVTGLAGNFGGGVDIGVNDRISIRLIQVDAAYARFHGVGSTVPRFSAGLVLHLGKPR